MDIVYAESDRQRFTPLRQARWRVFRPKPALDAMLSNA